MSPPGGTTKEQKALLDRLRPMARKIARKRAELGRVVPFEECWDIAQSALHDAVRTWDPRKGDIEVHAHATIDHALLDAVTKAKRRAHLPGVKAIAGLYAHARELRARGDVLGDSDEDTLRHLCETDEELAAAFGVRLAASAEEQRADRERAEKVQDTLRQLSPYQAQILWLRFVDDVTLEDISQATGTSTATVHRDLEKAALRFHALLRARGFKGSGGEGDTGPPRDDRQHRSV